MAGKSERLADESEVQEGSGTREIDLCSLYSRGLIGG